MFTLRVVVGFCVRVTLFYGLLMVPWPGLQNTYGRFYRAVGDVVFGSFGPGGLVSFEPRTAPHPLYDTEIVLQKLHSPAVGRIPTTSRYMGFMPTAFVIALVLATPLPWARRWLALCWALLWVNLYVAARVALVLVDTYSGNDPLALFKFSPFWKHTVFCATEVVCRSTAGWHLFPIFIWVMVCFRRDDLNRIVRRGGLRVRPDTGSGGNTGVAES